MKNIVLQTKSIATRYILPFFLSKQFQGYLDISKSFLIFAVICLLFCAYLINPAQAEVLGPGWFSVTTDPVSPEQAQLYYEQKARVRTRSLRYKDGPETTATEQTTEIIELACALQHDPKLIYEYVHNHIDYVPYFGSLKGATLTYLDRSGNDFDQASLMIALLRASGYTASYEYGTMIISVHQLANWIGIATPPEDKIQVIKDKIQLAFTYAGIPIEFPSPFQNDSELRVPRVSVKAKIEGVEYRFDPALKAYTYTPKIDIGQALDYSRSNLLAAVTNGATVTSDYVQHLNEAALAKKLVEYSSNLASTIRSKYPNSTLEEIVSGRSIIETTLSNYSTSLPLMPVIIKTWDKIPSEYIARLRIEHVGIDHTFDIPEIAGKRLTVTYVGDDYHPELRLEGELIAAGTATIPNSKYDLILTIDHPYATDDGNYCDQSATYNLKSGGTYALFCAFTGISKEFRGQLT